MSGPDKLTRKQETLMLALLSEPTHAAALVQLLAARLRQLDAAELPTGEKARLTATLADALLRAIGVDVLD